MNSSSTVSMHPVLSSIVHLPFKTALQDVGCSEFTQSDFNQTIHPHLHVLPGEASISEVEMQQLWQGMLSGEVMAVECRDDEALVFHVRGKAFSKFVDMRFEYLKDAWRVLGVTSIHTRPFWRSRLQWISITSGAVLASGILGFLLANRPSPTMQPPLSQQTVQTWAASNGYQLVSKQTAVAPPQAAIKTSATKEASPPIASRPIETSFAFTFKSGMAVHDISAFLATHHLVANAYAFDLILKQTGVDKSIWPGTYTFKSGMNQSQIIQVLKSTPKH